MLYTAIYRAIILCDCSFSVQDNFAHTHDCKKDAAVTYLDQLNSLVKHEKYPPSLQ